MKSCALMSVFLVAAALALAALAFLLIQASPATEARRQADLEYQRQRDAQDLQERAERAELNRRLYDAWIPAAQAAGAGVILAVPVAVGVAGYAWLLRPPGLVSLSLYPSPPAWPAGRGSDTAPGTTASLCMLATAYRCPVNASWPGLTMTRSTPTRWAAGRLRLNGQGIPCITYRRA